MTLQWRCRRRFAIATFAVKSANSTTRSCAIALQNTLVIATPGESAQKSANVTATPGEIAIAANPTTIAPAIALLSTNPI